MTAPASVAAGTTFMVSTFRYNEELPVEIISSASVDRGASAMIFIGTLKLPDTTPTTVALKIFPILLREHEQEMLRRELRTMSKVSHNCILPFIGTAALGGRTIIVSPFMKNGNLLVYVRANPGVDRRLLIKQVAEAINFLHVHARVVHGDLKCENVLVSNSGNALVTDFGLSSLVDKEESSATTLSAIRGCNTLRFAAPELLLGPEDTDYPSSSPHSFQSKTRETDVYAFGMLLLQAFTGEVPWPELRNEAVLLRVARGARPARPGGDVFQLGLSDPWWAVCLKCWQFDPRDRPSMLQVWNQLEGIGGSETSFYDTNPTYPTGPAPASLLPLSSPNSFMTESDYWKPYTRATASPPYRYPITSGINSLVYGTCEGTVDVVRVIYDSRNGRIIYATNIYSVEIIEASTGLALSTPLHHEGAICALCLHPTSRRFFSCSEDSNIIEWNTVSSSTYGVYLSCRKMAAHSDTVTCMAHSPDGKLLVSGSLDCTIRVWDSETRNTIGSPIRGETGIRSVAFSPDSSMVASGSEDGIIRLWHVSTRTRLSKLMTPTMAPICCLSFALDGRRVISVSRSAQSIYVWRTSSGELVGQWKSNIGSPIAISPSGHLLAYRSLAGGDVYVCDAQTGKRLRQYTCTGKCSIPAMSFSSNNQSLAVGYFGCAAPVIEIFGATHPHQGPAISYDGRMF